jgi:hypothetical protein
LRGSNQELFFSKKLFFLGFTFCGVSGGDGLAVGAGLAELAAGGGVRFAFMEFADIFGDCGFGAAFFEWH